MPAYFVNDIQERKRILFSMWLEKNKPSEINFLMADLANILLPVIRNRSSLPDKDNVLSYC